MHETYDRKNNTISIFVTFNEDKLTKIFIPGFSSEIRNKLNREFIISNDGIRDSKLQFETKYAHRIILSKETSTEHLSGKK